MSRSIALNHLLRLLPALLLSSAALAQQNPSPSSHAEIAALISKTYDQPQHKVHSAPIVVHDDHAIADWQQGDKAGRALLQRSAQGWQIILCAGSSLRQKEGLIAAGLAPELAAQLAASLQQAEQHLPAATVAKFDAFGTVLHH